MSGGVSGTKGGFNLLVSDGTLSTGFGIMNTQVNSAGNQGTHQFPDYRSWSLDWTAPSSGSSYRVTVTNWGSTASNTNQLRFNAIGESATCVFTNSKWYVIASNGSVVN